VPWNDQSGDRLRAWTDLPRSIFYDAEKVALVPMGFCYPGKAKGGDRPPRPECAPLWHQRIFSQLPADRLTLLVGRYAQAAYLPRAAPARLTDRVRAFGDFGPDVFPLPHPAWRSVLWMRDNPWFESDVRPALVRAVRAQLA
jgi:uracil-DNA glycosylase